MSEGEGGISEVIRADVTDEESCKNAVAKTVELYGALYILVKIGKMNVSSNRRILSDARSWGCWHHGECYCNQHGGMGPRLSHERYQHGAYEPPRHFRGAKARPGIHR